MNIKKVSAMIVAAFIALFTACGKEEYRWVVKIDGQEMTPSEYVVAQMSAYIEAQSYILGADISSAQIDGITAEEWIENKTIENLKEYRLIETEFAGRQLEVGKEAEEFIADFCEEGWENVSGFYSENGLDKKRYMNYLMGLYKSQLVFNDIFLSENSRSVSDREIKDYIEKNICRVRYFIIPKINDDGSYATQEQLSRINRIAERAHRLNAEGKSMARIAGEYLPKSGEILGSSADFSNGELYVYTDYISGGTANEFTKSIISARDGSAHKYETENCWYICRKLPAYDTESDYLVLRQNTVNLLKASDFSRYVKEKIDDMQVEYNTAAVKYYSPEKIVTEYN